MRHSRWVGDFLSWKIRRVSGSQYIVSQWLLDLCLLWWLYPVGRLNRRLRIFWNYSPVQFHLEGSWRIESQSWWLVRRHCSAAVYASRAATHLQVKHRKKLMSEKSRMYRKAMKWMNQISWFALFTTVTHARFRLPLTTFVLFIDSVVFSNASSTVGLSTSSTSAEICSRDPLIAAFII